MQGLAAPLESLLATVTQQAESLANHAATKPPAVPGRLQSLGIRVAEAGEQLVALLEFVGESAQAALRVLAHPRRIRWRPIAFNIRSGGLAAIPIVVLLSFMLGVVVAYQ